MYSGIIAIAQNKRADKQSNGIINHGDSVWYCWYCDKKPIVIFSSNYSFYTKSQVVYTSFIDKEKGVYRIVMKNRYIKKLRTNNQDILEVCPHNPFLFFVLSKEIEKIYRKGDSVLEIGTGEGDSVLYVLQNTNINIDLLDASSDFLDIAKKRLKKFNKRLKFIYSDAYDYLKNSKSYNIIFSSMTLHNFNQKDKKVLLEEIYRNLNKGGYFILLDKVYPGENNNKLLEVQIMRYKKYLKPSIAKAISDHEIQDAKDEYRMDESSLLSLLKNIGFSTVLKERLERDCVIFARK